MQQYFTQLQLYNTLQQNLMSLLPIESLQFSMAYLLQNLT